MLQLILFLLATPSSSGLPHLVISPPSISPPLLSLRPRHPLMLLIQRSRVERAANKATEYLSSLQ
eukprot:209916-Hanusia_phi.AAC.1